MASNVICLTLLALVGAALGNPMMADTSSTSSTASTPTTANMTNTTAGTNSTNTTTCPGGINYLSILTEHQKQKICNVSNQQPICTHVGTNDLSCCHLAMAANGTNPRCVAINVCAFTVEPSVSTTNGSNSTGLMDSSSTTTPSTTTPSTTTGSTTADSTTADSTTAGSTTLGSNTTDPQPILFTNNTVYISCAPIPNNTISLHGCPNGRTTFVTPCSPSAGPTTVRSTY